jgi:hypothetical protein
MYDEINIAMFEWAITVQHLIKEGWTFGEIDYGDRGDRISPKMTILKGKVKHAFYNPLDYDDIEKLNRLYDESCIAATPETG